MMKARSAGLVIFGFVLGILAICADWIGRFGDIFADTASYQVRLSVLAGISLPAAEVVSILLLSAQWANLLAESAYLAARRDGRGYCLRLFMPQPWLRLACFWCTGCHPV